MPAVPRTKLTTSLLDALDDSGVAVELGSSPSRNPLSLVLHAPMCTANALVHIWTLTFGGRKSLPNEYRVQMTSVASPLRTLAEGCTVILGYEPQSGAFAGFDAVRHRSFTQGSPSVQIDINVVRAALSTGIVCQRKGNQEVVCGIRADHLANYILSASKIHRLGKKPTDFGLLSQVTQGKQPDERQLAKLSAPRQRVIQEIGRWTRDGNFRKRVLQAYDNRCAITGIQMRLVDAAHIVPVGNPDSTDDVTNGIALSPTYHRAYDRGLVYFDDHFAVRLCTDRSDRLRDVRLDGGLADMQRHVGRKLILPIDPQCRPATNYIRRANELRKVV